MNPKSNANTKLCSGRLIKMEVFLDFDPVFPGWPPMEATEEIGNELHSVDHRQVSEGLLDLDVQRSHGFFLYSDQTRGRS